MHQELCNSSTSISFTAKLWQVFRVIITSSLDELKGLLGEAVDSVMATIGAHIQCLFMQVLQFDPKTLRLEAEVS